MPPCRQDQNKGWAGAAQGCMIEVMKTQNILKLCLVQMTSATGYAANIATMQTAVTNAQGCDLLVLPEVAGLMNRNAVEAAKLVGLAENDPFIAACQTSAKTHGLWIHTGSTPILGPDGRFLNHSDLINAEGQIVASYDKIHLFDATLEGQKPIGESKRFAPGEKAVLAETPWGKWGMAICYDLRFPHLFRAYAHAGANVIFVPSAFTVPTGKAHWEVLLRARAIENGVWIVAAAQVGLHEDKRQTYGHSLVISPWGDVVLDMGGQAEGTATIELDLKLVSAARQQLPSLTHDRAYQSP